MGLRKQSRDNLKLFPQTEGTAIEKGAVELGVLPVETGVLSESLASLIIPGDDKLDKVDRFAMVKSRIV